MERKRSKNIYVSNGIVNKFFNCHLIQNEHQEDRFPAEGVFKKPLPPILKKEESTPPVRIYYLTIAIIYLKI